MSHSTVTVVVRDAKNADEAILAAQEALSPFNENLEVDDYFVPIDEASVREIAPEYGTLEADTSSIAEKVGKYYLNDAFRGHYDAETKSYGYMTSYNPKSRWDWYQLGGRWNGFYMLKPNVHDSLLGVAGSFGTSKNLENCADIVQKKDIDFTLMRSLAEQEASLAYDKFEEATRGIAVPPSWDDLCREALENPNASVEDYVNIPEEKMKEIRVKFHNTPWILALKNADMFPVFSDVHSMYFVNAGGREAYVKNAGDSVISTFALLLDGEWIERGEMGWFGLASKEKDNDAWLEEFNTKIDSLPDDAWLAVYDVHI